MEPDHVQAVIWFSEVAKQGHEYAVYALGKLHLEEGSTEAALRGFQKAAEQGNEYAQYFLDHMNDPQGPPLLTSATRFLHHMSRIFQDEGPPPQPGIHFVESKLRQKIMEKRLALGHRADDHEDQPIAIR